MNQVHTYSETSIYLVEKDLIKNFGAVFGVDCPFFGKMLYIYLARGYNRAKISFLRFLDCLFPLFHNDNRQDHNKIVFEIFDIDRDNELNILNLLYLQMNLSPRT